MTRAILERAMTEDELLTAVTDALTLYRWRWSHHRRSDRALLMGHPGFPDIIAVKGPRLIVAELKTEQGRLTINQDVWLDAFDEAGAEWWVVRPTNLDAFLAMLGQGV